MQVEIRGKTVEVSGYVNATGRDSKPMLGEDGYFVEQVMPGAFQRAIERADSIPMLLNHDRLRILASTGDGMELREDAVGLFVRATTSDAHVLEKAKAGKLSGWSFGFIPISERTTDEGGMRHRELREIELLEVSLLDDTRNPAYIATSVFTRDESAKTEEFRAMDGQIVETRESEDAECAPDLREFERRIAELGIIEAE